jgi:hypothetical protein
MEIKLKAKSVYGKVLVYPVCEKSNLLIRLTGKKTFDDTDMFVLERLGYSVSWEAEIQIFWRLHHENRIYIWTTYRISGECPGYVSRSCGHHSWWPGVLVRDSFWYLGSQIF